MLSLREVSKSFGAVRALEPTSLECAGGETTVLIGPSGCGKSTLLKLMNGLHLPDTGEVWHDGERLGPHNVLTLRQRTGYVIQEGGLFPHLTARANVELLARSGMRMPSGPPTVSSPNSPRSDSSWTTSVVKNGLPSVWA